MVAIETMITIGVMLLYANAVYHSCRRSIREEALIRELLVFGPPAVAPPPPRIDWERKAPLWPAASESRESCPICFEDLNGVKYKRKTACCQHLFCSECLQEWAKKKPTCPLCITSFA